MWKRYLSYRKTVIKYLKEHPEYNALIHALGGIGIGILIASPYANPHPVRWALVFMGLSILGHLYALTQRK